MEFKAPKININEAKKSPQKLQDVLPFLKASKEEILFNEKVKESTERIARGNVTIKEATEEIEKYRPSEKVYTDKEIKKFIEGRSKLAEQLGYIVLQNEDNYFSLKKNDCKIEMHLDIAPNAGGYQGGRISSIVIRSDKNKEEKLEYLGAIDVDVSGIKNKELKKVFDEMVNYFN